MSPEELRAQGWKRNSRGIWTHPKMVARAKIHRDEEDVVEELMAVIEFNLAERPVLTNRVVVQRTCTDCGCLLHPGETCPACRWLVVRWCEDADIRHSWRHVPYALAEEVAAA